MQNPSFKHLLGIEHLSCEEIELILQTTDSMKEITQRSIKKVPTLKGKTVINLFFEPSTRTKLSFEIAAKRLSADTIGFSSATSSLSKGENLLDTVKNCEAMLPDVIVIRHPCSGASHFVSQHINCSVINAGDGINQHPTQALLDIFTIKERINDLKGIKIAIIGDIKHSRVAHSDIMLFTKMGANVFVSGPGFLMNPFISVLGAKICDKIEDAICDADVIILLRIQKERFGNGVIPSEREYAMLYGINMNRIKSAKENVIVMHPGPVNWGVEISPDIMDYNNNIILDQVTNGVALRMALLYILSNQGERE